MSTQITYLLAFCLFVGLRSPSATALLCKHRFSARACCAFSTWLTGPSLVGTLSFFSLPQDNVCTKDRAPFLPNCGPNPNPKPFWHEDFEPNEKNTYRNTVEVLFNGFGTHCRKYGLTYVRTYEETVHIEGLYVDVELVPYTTEDFVRVCMYNVWVCFVQQRTWRARHSTNSYVVYTYNTCFTAGC